MSEIARGRDTIIEKVLAGGGEMGERVRAFDWANSPLGPVECWPRILLTTVQILLGARFPMFLWWGPELIQFYNDDYIPSLGAERHPSALGARGRECWPEVWSTIGSRIERVLASGVAEFDENHFLPIVRDGRLDEAYWTYSYSPVRDDAGTPVGVLVIMRETTGRVRAERSLAVSERRLHNAFEHAVTGLAITELDGSFIQVNPAYCRITGYSREELASMDILTLVHPEHRAEHDARLKAMFSGENPGFVIEERYRRKDGSDIWVRKSVSILPGVSDRTPRRVNLVEDIDASRKAEEERARLYFAERAARKAAEEAEARMATVFRQTPAFICLLRGQDHFVEMANDACRELVGRRKLVGRPLAEAVPEVADRGYLGVLDRVLETGEMYVGTEVPIALRNTPDGPPARHVVNFVFQPLLENDGSRSGVFVHGVDMTEEVRARRELETVRLEADEARHRAEEANMARSQFLTMMSHELRTPLNAIGGYAQLLDLGVRGPVTPDQRADLARIQAAQQHLLGLINSVLNFAKLEAGHVHYDIADVPLMACLEGVEMLVAPQFRVRGLQYALRADPAIAGEVDAIMVRADEEKLRQIMVNLLTNATKFTEPGGSVTVTASSCAPRDDTDVGDARPMVAVTVADTGIGISATRLESIFEPFVQVNRRLSSPDEGVGLGLAISRDLARAMGGDLVAQSEPGVGSVFTLTLPVGG